MAAHQYPFDRVDNPDHKAFWRENPYNPTDLTDSRNYMSQRAKEIIHEDDMVNNPPHYDLGGLQVIDIRDMLLQRIEKSDILSYPQADYWSRSWEYMTRFMEKGGVQDLRKAKWYLDRLVESFDPSLKP